MSFVPVRVNTLRPGHAVLFDVYILLGERHVHYIRKSDPFDDNRLSNLKTKGVRKLYVKEEDEPLYLSYLDQGLDSLAESTVEISDRAKIAHDAIVTDAENCTRSFETEQGYRGVENRMNKVVSFLASDKGALPAILRGAGCAIDDFQHAANVTSLSAGLALKVGGLESKEILELSLAALVHDIGKSKLGFTTQDSLDQLPPDRQKAYRSHPEKAVEILATLKYVTPALLRMINDHEELGEGEGYPGKKNLAKLPLTSRILGLCNLYDRVSMRTGKPHAAISKEFFEEKAHLVDMELLTQLNESLLGK
jgi:HD-GYP domain-containing protein (c-di-GMP phosphodiesterase class II)